jgi:hypothetical protein
MSSFSEYIKKLMEVAEDEAPSVPTIVSVNSKDHNDIHYLYKLRKGVALVVGKSGMKGFNEDQIKEMHSKMVAYMIENAMSHWYDDYSDDLDKSLPDDLKVASSGYYPPSGASIFDLTADDHTYRKCLEENDVMFLWKAPTARKKIPKDHFLDQANKKYPYKNADGSVNCGGLMAAYKYARGARGASPRPQIALKAKQLIKANCGKEVVKEKKAEIIRVGKLV